MRNYREGTLLMSVTLPQCEVQTLPEYGDYVDITTRTAMVLGGITSARIEETARRAFLDDYQHGDDARLQDARSHLQRLCESESV